MVIFVLTLKQTGKLGYNRLFYSVYTIFLHENFKFWIYVIWFPKTILQDRRNVRILSIQYYLKVLQTYDILTIKIGEWRASNVIPIKSKFFGRLKKIQ